MAVVAPWHFHDRAMKPRGNALRVAPTHNPDSTPTQ